jgi:ribonuclease P protein component
VVLHLLEAADPAGGPAQVGFVVSKAVGGAVVRNQVKRRLRHLARERHPSLPGSAVLVVRALPAAATASYADLGADLDRALGRLLGRSSSVSGTPSRTPVSTLSSAGTSTGSSTVPSDPSRGWSA